MTLTLILLVIGATLLFMAIRSLRAQRLKERHALLFALLGVPFLALAAWPNAVGWVAIRLGIEYQTVLLLAVTTFFLAMNFKLLSIVSVQERRIACMAQLLALLTQKFDGDRDRDRPALPLERRVEPDTDREVA
jgi:hypothetical protein